MADIKETLLSTLRNGKEVLNEREMARKCGQEISTRRGQVERKLEELHPEYLHLVLVEAEMVTPWARRLRFASESGYLPPFEAGNYINIHVRKNGVLTSRPYSISSSPAQRGYIEITVEEVPDGFVSSYLVRDAKVGDRFVANGPSGYFHDNPVFHRKSKVFLAGGSGVTPFVSMIEETIEKNLDRKLVLFYGTRTVERALYHEKLLKLSESYPDVFRYIPVLSDEEKEGYEKGFITAELIGKYVENPMDYTYYLCGPPVMLEFCIGELDKLGIPRRMVRRELFGTRRDIWNDEAWPEDVPSDAEFNMTVEGRTYRVKAFESLLTSLERNGIRVNACCRSGECSLCRVHLKSGNVFTAPGALLRYTDLQFGYIHSCKAYPISDVEIEF